MKRAHWYVHVLLIVWALISLVPVLWMISASFQTDQQIYAGVRFWPESWNFDNYVNAWREAEFGKYVWNSVLYTFVVTTVVVFLAAIASYAFARLRFPAKNFVYGTILAFIFLPVPAAFIPLYVILVQLGLVNTRIGYMLPLINGSLPVAIFLLRRFFEAIPREVEESAMVDGASRFRVFWQIAVPLAAPVLATIAVITAMGIWNEFTLALVVFSDTELMPLQVGLQTFQGTYFSRYGLMMAALTISSLPMIIIYLSFQRFIIRGVMAGAVKG